MAATSATIQVSGLGRQKLAALRKQAKTPGMSAEGYARHLIEEGILLDLRAHTTPFDELFASVQERFRKSEMCEADLDQLVRESRARHRRTGGKKG